MDALLAMYPDMDMSESASSESDSSDSGIDPTDLGGRQWRSDREQEIIDQYRHILEQEAHEDDDEEEDEEDDKEEEQYITDMNDLNAFYAKLIADGKFARGDEETDGPCRTASAEEEEEVQRALRNDPELQQNTLRNTHPPAARASAADASSKKRSPENHVHFLNGSPQPTDRKSASGAEDEGLPAWDLPVSPMDKAFRSRLGGPLGTGAAIPVEFSSSSDSDSNSDSDEDPEYSVSDGSSASASNSGPDGGFPGLEGGSDEDDAEDGDLRRFLQLERAIFSVISPYMTTSPSGTKNSPTAVVFSRDLLRSISKAAVKFILPKSSAPLVERSADGVYSVLRMFEGAEVADSYRLLMDLLKSVLEELIAADDNLDSNSSPPIIGYDKVGLPKLSTNYRPKKGKRSRNESSRAAEGTSAGGDDCIPAEWTHPLIADLLKQNPSLRAYVQSRSDAEARAAGFEKAHDSPARAAVSGQMYTLSSSSSDSESDEGDSVSMSDSDASSDSGGNLADEADPLTKLMQTSMASTDVNTASPKRSPKKRGDESDPLNDSTVEVGPVTTDSRSPVRLASKVTPPRKPPSRVSNDAAASANSSFIAGDYSDEDVLNEFQQRVANSPVIKKMADITDPSLADVDITKTSPKLKAEARRRRKHRNVRHDDSSSAGNATDEERRKELHKNAPYDDSSSADEDSEAERIRRAKHDSVAYDDSTSAGNRSEEERRKLKHMNVPYDDSSSAGEKTEEEERRVRHQNVPYDDSSTAGGGFDGSDESVDSEGLVATAALTSAVKDWDKSNEEEVIRRKYRSEARLQASRRSDEGNADKDVGEDDDDYDFASAVVKYWDQLLGPPDNEVSDGAGKDDTAEARRASMMTMQSFNTTAAVGRPETPSTDNSLDRSPEAIKEASYEEFKSMSPTERNEYLYGAIDQCMGHDHLSKDLNMVQSDLHLWQEMDRTSSQQQSEPSNVDLSGKSTTQRDYATLRQEIVELANLLGVSPSDVLLNGGTTFKKSIGGNMATDANGVHDNLKKSSKTTRSNKKKLSTDDLRASLAQDATDDALAGFLNGLSSGGASHLISSDGGLRLFDNSESRPTRARKKVKYGKTKKPPRSQGYGATPKKKSGKAKNSAPPSPSLLAPTTSFIKSAPTGPQSKKAKAASSTALSNAARDRGKRRVVGREKNSSTSVAKELKGAIPAGSVNFVSVHRKSKDGMDPVLVQAQKNDPPSPVLFLQSPEPMNLKKKVALNRPSSAPPKRTSTRVASSLNDTDIVVVNNTPIFPLRGSVRPSSAPPAKRKPQRAQSPELCRRSRDAVKYRPRASRIGKSLATENLSKSKARTQRKLSASLSAPTMASISRTNDTLSKALDFMNIARPRQPWDSYKGLKASWTGKGSPPKKKKSN